MRKPRVGPRSPYSFTGPGSPAVYAKPYPRRKHLNQSNNATSIWRLPDSLFFIFLKRLETSITLTHYLDIRIRFLAMSPQSGNAWAIMKAQAREKQQKWQQQELSQQQQPQLKQQRSVDSDRGLSSSLCDCTLNLEGRDF